MRAVAVVVLGGETRHRSPAHAVDALRDVDVLLQIWMVEIDSRVDVAYEDGWAAPGDRVRLRCVNLPHVPLQWGKRVRVTCRRVREIAGWRTLRTGLLVGQSRRKSVGRCRVLDAIVLEQVVAERSDLRLRDHHPYLGILVDDRAARSHDRRLRVARQGLLLVEDHVVRPERRWRDQSEDDRQSRHDCLSHVGIPFRASGAREKSRGAEKIKSGGVTNASSASGCRLARRCAHAEGLISIPSCLCTGDR